MNSYCAFVPWLNIMKQAGIWYDEASGVIDQDTNGYIETVGVGQTLKTNILNPVACGVPNWNTVGNYLIIYYDGDGAGLGTSWKLNSTGSGGSVSVISHDTSARRVVYSVTHSALSGNHLQMIVTANNAASPMTNIRIIPEEYEADYLAGDRWNPDFLATKAPFAFIRFMNFSQINGSAQTTWGDRMTSSHRSYSKKGGSSAMWTNAASYSKHAMVPYEEQIDLCNELGVGGWFCVPAEATSTWWTGLAELIYADLDPSLKAYIEYSNEVWNFAIGGSNGQAQFCYDEGQVMYPLESNAYYRGYYYAAHQARLIFEEFGDVFAAAPSRFVPVFAWQKDTIGVSELIMDWENLVDVPNFHWSTALYWAGQNGGVASKLGTSPQALTTPVAPHIKTTVTMSVDEIMDEMDLEYTLEGQQHEDLADVCAVRGIGLCYYEGGQHLVGVGAAQLNSAELTALLIGANRSPRMQALYLSWWQFSKAMKAIAGSSDAPTFAYADIYAYDENGSWGLLETQAQILEPSAAYKWLGTMQYIEQNS